MYVHIHRLLSGSRHALFLFFFIFLPLSSLSLFLTLCSQAERWVHLCSAYRWSNPVAQLQRIPSSNFVFLSTDRSYCSRLWAVVGYWFSQFSLCTYIFLACNTFSMPVFQLPEMCMQVHWSCFPHSSKKCRIQCSRLRISIHAGIRSTVESNWLSTTCPLSSKFTFSHLKTWLLVYKPPNTTCFHLHKRSQD